jgi:predicted ester cyclase
MRAMPKLCAIVAYYPTFIPTAINAFPHSIFVQIHIASAQNFGTFHPSYTYPETAPGFAEIDSEQHDKIGARLAWTRSLGLIRRGFGIHVDLEAIWENHTALEFVAKDADATMKTMVAEPYVNHVPTMTGGVGYKDLRRFYADFFIPGNPPDLKMKLLSRTVGTDRVVDELFASFTHTKEVPWMLPGIPATGKRVDIVVVAVVCIRGGKLYHEHIHWDQASVLVQIGLLDPQLVPSTFKTIQDGAEKEVEELPVIGSEGAMKVLDEETGESNLLLRGW